MGTYIAYLTPICAYRIISDGKIRSCQGFDKVGYFCHSKKIIIKKNDTDNILSNENTNQNRSYSN